MKKQLFTVHRFSATAAGADTFASIPFRRVSKSGPTIDGREVKAEWLEQAAKNYDPEVYAARINCEHLRGMNPSGDFGAFGDVLALKTEKAADGSVVLLAQIKPNDKAKAINAADQKVYPSIEIVENFAGTGEAYMIGLGLTDTPASLGTERLTFSRLGKMTGALTFGDNEVIDLQGQEAENAATTSWRQSFAALREGLANKFKAKDKESIALADEVRQTISEFADSAVNRIELEAKRADQLEAELRALKQQFKTLNDEHTQLRAELGQDTSQHTTRPPVSGGDDSANLAQY